MFDGSANDDLLYLDPRIVAPARALLRQAATLTELVDGLGSPLNVVLPERVVGNLAAFHDVYAKHRLRGTVYFAAKANRSYALLRALAATAAGADVASVGELRHALGCGFTGARLLATGPKDDDFLWLAARVAATVQVDSPWELRRLVEIVTRFALPRVAVTLRLSGFPPDGVTVRSRPSRFGLEPQALGETVETLVASTDVVECVGVGYHLDTSSLAEKAAAAESCLLTLRRLRERGLRPTTIDLGGGFGVSYLADGDQWRDYTTALSESVLGTRKAMTWHGYGYGLRAEHGTLRGALQLYPGDRAETGPGYVERLLASSGPRLNRPLATLILENLYQVAIEPGRSLVDQCGLTLVSVVEVGERRGQKIVRVAANRNDVSLEAGGVLADPVVVRRGSPPADDHPCQAYLVGNLCLEHDFLTRRRVSLRGTPVPGDLLAFVNTAGYFSDFDATSAMRQPTAATVAVTSDTEPGGEVWRWCRDERYWPVQGDQP